MEAKKAEVRLERPTVVIHPVTSEEKSDLPLRAPGGQGSAARESCQGRRESRLQESRDSRRQV